MKKMILFALIATFSFSAANCMKQEVNGADKKELTQEEAAKRWTSNFFHSIVDDFLEGNVNPGKIESDFQDAPNDLQPLIMSNLLLLIAKNLKVKNFVPQPIIKDLLAFIKGWLEAYSPMISQEWLDGAFLIYKNLRTELLFGDENKELEEALKAGLIELAYILDDLICLLGKNRDQDEEASFLEKLKLIEPKITALLAKTSIPLIRENANKLKNIVEIVKNSSELGFHMNREALLGLLIASFASIAASEAKKTVVNKTVVTLPVTGEIVNHYNDPTDIHEALLYKGTIH